VIRVYDGAGNEIGEAKVLSKCDPIGPKSSLLWPGRLWFWFDILIKELEHVLFPYWDGDVDRVVAVICCLANRGVNLQHVRLVQPFKLVCQGTARSRAVIIGSLNKPNFMGKSYACA